MRNGSLKNGTTDYHEVDGILKHWEFLWYLVEVLNKHSWVFKNQPECPAIHGWKQFRSFLRQCGPDTVFDSKRFGAWESKLDTVPLSVMRWAVTRRIFYITAPMQERFEQIHMGNIKMKDVIKPFDDFGIRFATPIISSTDPNFSCSFAWITDWFKHASECGGGGAPDVVDDRTGICVWPDSITQYRGVSKEDQAKLERLIRTGSKKQAGLFWQKLFDELPELTNSLNYGVVWSFSNDYTAEEWLAEAEQRLKAGQTDAYNIQAGLRAIRLVINLCIYLQSIPAEYEGQEGTKWHADTYHGGKAGAVTDGTLVCQIGGSHIIDSMIRSGSKGVSEEALRLVRPHWRRAHTRRPPGKGSDPNAERSVKVRHTLVCSELQSAGAAMRGAVSVLK